MRTILVAALCLAAGWAVANEPTVKVYTLTVQERLQNLELINVTAEKSPAEDAEPLDAELADILREIEALEDGAER